MFVDRCCEKESFMNSSNDMSGMNNMGCCQVNECPCVMECPQERVCHVQTLHNVPHVVPINTRVINHHIYRHTYQPMYTCTMENQVSNVCAGNGSMF